MEEEGMELTRQPETTLDAEDRQLLLDCATCLRIRYYAKSPKPGEHEQCAAEVDPTAIQKRLVCSRELARIGLSAKPAYDRIVL